MMMGRLMGLSSWIVLNLEWQNTDCKICPIGTAEIERS